MFLKASHPIADHSCKDEYAKEKEELTKIESMFNDLSKEKDAYVAAEKKLAEQHAVCAPRHQHCATSTDTSTERNRGRTQAAGRSHSYPASVAVAHQSQTLKTQNLRLE